MEQVPTRMDLVDVIRMVLKASDEPLTINKIRERLPRPYDTIGRVELMELLDRQVAANVLVMCPKYRSAQNRYWDRSLREHAQVLLRESLAAGPMPWSELRKRFPKYLRHLAESVLNEELARGVIYRHPPATPHAGFRYATEPADVRRYVARELEESVARLVGQGLGMAEVREAYLHLLHELEWGDGNPTSLQNSFDARGCTGGDSEHFSELSRSFDIPAHAPGDP